MLTTLRTLEELTANAWPGLQTVFYDGWIVRFANGYTRRANCVLPLYTGELDPAKKIAACEDFYRQRGLPVIFKLPGRVEARALNDRLLSMGYQAEADTAVHRADLRGWADDTAADVQFSPTQSPAWEQAFQSLSGLRAEQQAHHSQILAAIVPRKCFAALHAGGQITAVALGVLQNGYLGVYDVVVHPSYRRQGQGERLMRSLLAWGVQQGAHSAYLQVMLNNPNALRLYAKLGFTEQYQYWYCVKA